MSIVVHYLKWDNNATLVLNVMEYVWLDVPIDSICSVVVAFTLACGLGLGFPENSFLHPLCHLLLCAARNGEVADNVNMKILIGTDYQNVYYVLERSANFHNPCPSSLDMFDP